MINELTQPAPTSLILRRTFDAPCERVFDAWLSPDVLRVIVSGDKNKVLDVAVDPRVGGSYRITWDTKDGVWAVGGIYKEIVKNQRIVFTWTFEEDDPSEVHETLITLEFHPRGNKTELVLTHTNLRDQTSRDNHAEGWGEAFDKLAKQVE